MSTKIYEAWRIPKSRINEFLAIINDGMFKNALARVKELMGKVSLIEAEQHTKTKYPDVDSVKYPKRYVRIIRYYMWEKVLEEAKKASEGSQRDPTHCLDCGVNIWIYKNHAYSIPNGEQFLWKGIKYPPWVEDYAYWNNTDQPEGITQKQWDARGKVWDKVCLDKWNDHRLWHDVISFKDPMDYIASQVKFESILFPDRYKQT